MATVILMLTLMSIALVHTARIVSLQHKIELNTQNYLYAKNDAQSGMASLHSFLLTFSNQYPQNWLTQAALSQQIELQTILNNNLIPNKPVYLHTATSVGTSPDLLARATQTESVATIPLLINHPPAPLILSGDLDVMEKLYLVSNPNGLGRGVPLSLWSTERLDLLPFNTIYCQQQRHLHGQCNGNERNPTQRLPFADNHHRASLPEDLLEYIFAVNSANYYQLKDSAVQVLGGCSELAATSTGLFWVDGDCVLLSARQIGTSDKPIVLIINSGELLLGDNSIIHGIVFVLNVQSNLASANIAIQGEAKIEGALISNLDLKINRGILSVVYSPEMADKIDNQASFTRLVRVKGSWRDF